MRNSIYDKVEEIAEEYALFTNKQNEWRESITIKEFGQLRELAIKELSLVPGLISMPSEKSVSKTTFVKPQNNNMQATKEEILTAEEKITPFISNQEIPKKETQQKELTKEERELAILLSIKED